MDAPTASARGTPLQRQGGGPLADAPAAPGSPGCLHFQGCRPVLCVVLGQGPMDALAFTAGALVTGGAIVRVGILLSLAHCTDLSCVFDH